MNASEHATLFPVCLHLYYSGKATTVVLLIIIIQLSVVSVHVQGSRPGRHAVRRGYLFVVNRPGFLLCTLQFAVFLIAPLSVPIAHPKPRLLYEIATYVTTGTLVTHVPCYCCKCVIKCTGILYK